MKTGSIVVALLVVIMMFTSHLLLAQPAGGGPAGGGPPSIPISGIELLLLGGAFFGVKKLLGKSKTK